VRADERTAGKQYGFQMPLLVIQQDGTILGIGPLGQRAVVVRALQIPQVAVLVEEAQDSPRYSVSATHLDDFDGKSRCQPGGGQRGPIEVRAYGRTSTGAVGLDVAKACCLDPQRIDSVEVDRQQKAQDVEFFLRGGSHALSMPAQEAASGRRPGRLAADEGILMTG